MHHLCTDSQCTPAVHASRLTFLLHQCTSGKCKTRRDRLFSPLATETIESIIGSIEQLSDINVKQISEIQNTVALRVRQTTQRSRLAQFNSYSYTCSTSFSTFVTSHCRQSQQLMIGEAHYGSGSRQTSSSPIFQQHIYLCSQFHLS